MESWHHCPAEERNIEEKACGFSAAAVQADAACLLWLLQCCTLNHCLAALKSFQECLVHSIWPSAVPNQHLAARHEAMSTVSQCSSCLCQFLDMQHNAFVPLLTIVSIAWNRCSFNHQHRSHIGARSLPPATASQKSMLGSRGESHPEDHTQGGFASFILALSCQDSQQLYSSHLTELFHLLV